MSGSEQLSSFTPAQMLEKASTAGIAKSKLDFWPMLLLAILAGMYIAFGGVFSTVVATGTMAAWPYGVVKLLQGIVFSTGLILVVVGGAELFTGNILLIIPLIQRKISITSMLRNWLVVYIGNFLGSIIVTIFVLLAGSHQFAGGMMGNTILTIADSKLHFSFLQATMLGVLCNILVCLAVWLSFSARNTSDKILAIIFPISAFIAAGFEHSVANMYLIPVGILLKTFDPAFVSNLGIDVLSLDWGIFLFDNLLPVTIGNIFGGGIFVALIYAYIYGKQIPVNDIQQ